MRSSTIPALLAATLFSIVLSCAASAEEPAPAQSTGAPCSQSAGDAKANEYVRQCLEVSPATHPPCNAANACELIIDEIRRGCAMLPGDRPAYCAEYADKDTKK
jgi:hypothetical protein